MSHRFHQLVTTPHAWRIAFSRIFPGTEAVNTLENGTDDSEVDDSLHAERRLFTRLSAFASWRSEYILRTRLLRSLSRGKPADPSGLNTAGSPRGGVNHGGSAHNTYNSDLITIVDHMHATFGTGFHKRLPHLIHGATDSGMASSSDPRAGKVDSWGFADPFGPLHFADVHPGDTMYGLGAGNVVGVPNSMDVSEPYGMIYVEGLPGGRAYYRSSEEKRGRLLDTPLEHTTPGVSFPTVSPTETLTSCWIAKSSAIPELSEGLAGFFVGSSQGVLSLHSLGTNPTRERRLERGELTARWLLSPGVPIIAIAADDSYSQKRQSSKRLWVVALNALGEVFYLVKFPIRRSLDRAAKLDSISMEEIAWETGRTVSWSMVESSRRKARLDPFDNSKPDGSYSPGLSGNRTTASQDQVTSELKELNHFLQKKPEYFRKVCEGWDMRRRLEVDFAASDTNGAGEHVVVISCGLDEEQSATVKRYTRCLSRGLLDESTALPYGLSHPHAELLPMTEKLDTDTQPLSSSTSAATLVEQPEWSFKNTTSGRHGSVAKNDDAPIDNMTEQWYTSKFLFGGLKAPQIMATAIDSSSYALLTTTEDPLLHMTASSTVSSPMSSLPGQMPFPTSSSDVPGQRARLFAAGTGTGTILVWNVRAPTSANIVLENTVKPIRIIYTDSPQISCLALTALYLVHGGNDGLVQAWDPLASSTDPIRTLNSRFSSRARRRLVQAEASSAGVGINLFAAGAICLDPDPTVLRGVVSLGSHLRYWTYSSQAIDSYKGNRRRLRRSERGSNQGPDRFSGTGRGALMEYIANEKLELERDKRMKRREDNKLSARYGVDLLGPGASEDEILAYATLLSEEAAKDDEKRRKSASEYSSSDTITEEAVASPISSTQEELDDDMSEAIRLSLQESNGFRASSLGDGDASSSSFTIHYAKSKRSSPSASPPRSTTSTSSPKLPREKIAEQTVLPKAEMDDLEFAIQLSKAEEESRAGKDFGVGGVKKGKGKAT